PMVSVILCTYNGGRTLARCLEALRNLSYSNYEVIVVDDGSTDDVPEITSQFAEDVRMIRTSNRGLGAARNTGLEAARGEIVAYIDDDAWPHEHWLNYLADTFAASDCVGVRGPNLPPADASGIAQCGAA